jgi:hypothetical protein
MNEYLTCKYCYFFNKDGYVDVLDSSNIKSECRRFAPRIFSGSGEGWSNQLFPHVKETDWCGEFENDPDKP